jgi:DNA-binding transcriptional LysR family regulator
MFGPRSFDLDRGARPVRLTAAGEMFLPRANAILNEADQARAELGLADMSRLTRFRLGMIEDFDADVTPRLLADMADELRQCQFLLETGASHRLHDALDARALDMIVATDMGVAMTGMEVHPLLVEPFVAAVPRGMPTGGFEVLRKLPLIRYTTRHHMGRMIAAHLVRQNLALSHRFELDSYHAIMAMVAEGAGWTILTPLGWMRAGRFRNLVELRPLPGAPLERAITLAARKSVLGDMPARIAERLRGLLGDLTVAPAVTELPWLEGHLRVLQSRNF